MGAGQSGAKLAAVEELLRRFADDQQLSAGAAMRAAVGGFFGRRRRDVGSGETMTEREAALKDHVYTTDDKIEAMCAVVSRAIYNFGNVVLVEDCDGVPAGFYFKKEDCENDITSVKGASEDADGDGESACRSSSGESSKKIRDIPHGTRLELIDDEKEFEKASDHEPIKVRAIAEGFIKKQHLRIQLISSFEESITKILQQKEHAHTLKKCVKILKAERLANNPLVNPVGCVIAEIDMQDPEKKKKKVAIVAWAGTDFAKRPMDVITDLAAAPASSTVWGEVLPRIQGHAAMLAQVQGQFQQYKNIMQRWMTDANCNHVVFTGHSLGAGCCFLAHLCAICTFYNFDKDREPSQFSNVLFESRGFAGPMVFYPEDAEHMYQTYMFESDEAIMESKRRNNASKEAVIRKLFAATSRNYVVDNDVVPRLPGQPQFAIPAAKEIMTHLGASSIIEAAGEGLNSEVTFAACKKAAHILHDKLLSKGAAMEMQDHLARFEHFSTMIVVMTDKDGKNSPLSIEEKSVSLPVKVMSCDDYKKMMFNPGEEKYNYYIDCHSWLPRSMEYWKRCSYCHRHCWLLLIGEHQARQKPTCCIECEKHHKRNGAGAPKLDDSKHGEHCGKEILVCRNHPCPRRPKTEGEVCCQECKDNSHTQECDRKNKIPMECPTWDCRRMSYAKDQPGYGCCRTCLKTQGKHHGPACENRHGGAAPANEVAAGDVGIVHNCYYPHFDDVFLRGTDFKMPNGNEVTILGTVDDKFYKVVWRGQEGRVKQKHIKVGVEKAAVENGLP